MMDAGARAGARSERRRHSSSPTPASHDFAPGSGEPAVLALRRDVLRRSGPRLRQSARGARRGGRVVFACWREAKRNPWQMIAAQGGAALVPRLPEVGPEDPGPFSFADETRVRRILERGWIRRDRADADRPRDSTSPRDRGSRRRSARCKRSAPPAARSRANPSIARRRRRRDPRRAGAVSARAERAARRRDLDRRSGQSVRRALRPAGRSRARPRRDDRRRWRRRRTEPRRRRSSSAAGSASAPRSSSASRCGVNSRLRQNRRRAGGGEDRGVGGLVLIERMRKRHQDRRPTDDGELRNGRSAGAADHQMRPRDARRQVGEEVGEFDRELQFGASGGDARPCLRRAPASSGGRARAPRR